MTTHAPISPTIIINHFNSNIVVSSPVFVIPTIAESIEKAAPKSSARKNTQAMLTAINVISHPAGFGRLRPDFLHI